MSAAPAVTPTTLVTIRVPVAMKERLDWMAKAMQRPRNYVFLDALRRYLDQEEWQLEDILAALSEAEHEEGTPHEAVMQEARSLIERARTGHATRPDAP